MDDYIKIALRFPKARILVNNLIIESQGNCSWALLQASIDYDLLPWGSHLPEEQLSHQECNALDTAEYILQKYLESKKIANKAEHLNTFRYSFSLFKTLEEKTNKNKIKCLRFTPALFDLLLQQIECI